MLFVAFTERFKELDELLDLGPLRKRAVGKLSGGQRRRIDIARALLHKPRILIPDEPTTGLDPQTRKAVWSVIEKLRKNQNMTVFLTTHYMEEAADVLLIILDNEMRNAFDNCIYFFEYKVEPLRMYLILGVSVVLLSAVYVLMNAKRRR